MFARLGADLSTSQQWQNLLAQMDYVNAHPLPDDASADTVQTRQLVIAALARAEATLQGTDQAAADTAYQDAQTAYQQFAAQQKEKETPSGLALWLAGLGLDLGSPLAKLGLYAGVGLVAYLALPFVVRAVSSGGSKSWNPSRRRRRSSRRRK